MTVFDRIVALLDSKGVAYDVSRHAPVFTSEEAAKVRGAPLASGRAARADACEQTTSRTAVRALLASEAGRAARSAVAQQRNAKAPRVFRICIRDLRCLTFEMRGMTRLAGACPLD